MCDSTAASCYPKHEKSYCSTDLSSKDVWMPDLNINPNQEFRLDRNVMNSTEFADPKALEKTFKSLEEWATQKSEQDVLADEDVVKKTIEMTGESYRAFSEMALKEKNRECWEPLMKREVHNHGLLSWVAK